MKDLYQILNRNRSASAQSIQDALNSAQARVNPRIAEAGKIIGHPGRRKQYDRVHHALEHIAVLRQGTGLQGTPFARQFEADFQLSPKDTGPATQKRKVTAQNIGGLGVKGWLFVSIFAIFFIGFIYLDSKDQTRKRNGLPVAARPQQAALTPVELPRTGAFDSSSSSTSTAIIIKTAAGGSHTLVKVLDGSDNMVTMAFIRSGDTHTFHLPYGNYTLRTANGSNWYGLGHKFGPYTAYSKPVSTFPLRQRGEQWTVELIEQTNGNLRQRRISASEF